MSGGGAEKDAARPEHVHDVSCAFGNPQCPAFGEAVQHGRRRVGLATIVLGWAVTGRVVIATRRCPRTGKSAGVDLGPDWPADPPPEGSKP